MTRSTAQHICWTTLLLVVPLLPSCSNEVIEADRERQKMENSPEFKRKEREAARKGIEGTTDVIKKFRLPDTGKRPPAEKKEEADTPKTPDPTNPTPTTQEKQEEPR